MCTIIVGSTMPKPLGGSAPHPSSAGGEPTHTPRLTCVLILPTVLASAGSCLLRLVVSTVSPSTSVMEPTPARHRNSAVGAAAAEEF